MQFHRELEIGFGFAMNLAAIDLNNSGISGDAGLPGGGAYLHRELQMAVECAARAKSQ